MPRRTTAALAAVSVSAILAACTGTAGDSSPEDAAGGGIPPQSTTSPAPNLGASDGAYPDSDSAGEAQQ
jgi:hypothetical protein